MKVSKDLGRVPCREVTRCFTGSFRSKRTIAFNDRHDIQTLILRSLEDLESLQIYSYTEIM